MRSPQIEDAEMLLDQIRVCCGETDFLLKTPEEWDMPISKEEQYIDQLNKNPRDIMILCVVDGEIVGNSYIGFGSARKNAHRATVGIAIREKYWGLGIGSILFDQLIAYAKSVGVYQVELEVMEHNSRAIALYEKMGFSIAAKLPNAIRQQDGRLLSNYFMVKEL